MATIERYKEWIVEHICQGYSLSSLQERFFGDQAMQRLRDISPALPVDRYERKRPFQFTLDDYQEVIQPHLPCIRVGERELVVKMRWETEHFSIRPEYDDFEVCFCPEERYSVSRERLQGSTDPNELLCALCDIEHAMWDWRDTWQKMIDECETDGRYLAEIRQRMLNVLEQEMRGLDGRYGVEAGPKTSKVQVNIGWGRYMVVEVDNDDLEDNLKHIGLVFGRTISSLRAMKRVPIVTIGPTYISANGIEALPQAPIEQSPYIEATRYILELSEAVLLPKDDVMNQTDDERSQTGDGQRLTDADEVQTGDAVSQTGDGQSWADVSVAQGGADDADSTPEGRLRTLVPLANSVLGQTQLVRFLYTIRGHHLETLCDDTLEPTVSAFFPMRRCKAEGVGDAQTDGVDDAQAGEVGETQADGGSAGQTVSASEPEPERLLFYPLGCSRFICLFGIDIEVPEDTIRDEWFSNESLNILSVDYVEGLTRVITTFGAQACIDTIPVSYQGASIVEAVIAEANFHSVCNVMADGVFRLFAEPDTSLIELE